MSMCLFTHPHYMCYYVGVSVCVGERDGKGRRGLMYLGQKASCLTLHKQGVTAGEGGRERWWSEEVSHEEGDQRGSAVKRVDQVGYRVRLSMYQLYLYKQRAEKVLLYTL